MYSSVEYLMKIRNNKSYRLVYSNQKLTRFSILEILETTQNKKNPIRKNRIL